MRRTYRPKLKLAAITDDKPGKLSVELSAGVHRDLLAYAEVLARETGQGVAEPTKLIEPMLARSWQRIACLQNSVERINHNRPAADDATL
jgi:hypothetical protein